MPKPEDKPAPSSKQEQTGTNEQSTTDAHIAPPPPNKAVDDEDPGYSPMAERPPRAH